MEHTDSSTQAIGAHLLLGLILPITHGISGGMHTAAIIIVGIITLNENVYVTATAVTKSRGAKVNAHPSFFHLGYQMNTASAPVAICVLTTMAALNIP